MEDSMFHEQFVTSAEGIKEAREALIELGRDIARRGNEVELWQAQIAYTQMFAKMGASKPGDDKVTKEYEAADKRLFSRFEKGCKTEDRLLFRCYWEFRKRLVYHHRAEGYSQTAQQTEDFSCATFLDCSGDPDKKARGDA
jgi:hypothetical protein